MTHAKVCPLWFLLLILSVTAWPVQAQKSIGRSDETLMIPAAEGADRGVVHCNHDGTFENGYSISHLVPPYYGCFAESFDLGYGLLEAAHFWFTQIGYYNDEPMDVYVWEGGVSGEPGEVLYMLPEVGGDHDPCVAGVRGNGRADRRRCRWGIQRRLLALPSSGAGTLLHLRRRERPRRVPLDVH